MALHSPAAGGFQSSMQTPVPNLPAPAWVWWTLLIAISILSLLAGLEPAYPLVLVAGLVVAGLSFYDTAFFPFWYAFGLGLLTGFLSDLGLEGGIFAMLVGFVLVYMIYMTSRTGQRLAWLITAPIVLTSIALALWMAVSLRWSPSPTYGFSKLTGYCFGNIGSLLVFGFLPPVLAFHKRAWTYMTFFGVAMAVAMIVLFLTVPVDARLGAFGVDPIWTARSIGACAIIVLWRGLQAKSPARTLLALALVGFMVLGILPTGSRMPFATTVLCLGGMILFHRRFALKLRVLVVVGVLLAALFAAVVLPHQIFRRFSNLSHNRDHSSAIRLLFWYCSFEEIIHGNPIGMGNGGFSNLILKNDTKLYPHNIFMETLVELGLPGFVILMVFFVLVIRKLLLVFRRAKTAGDTDLEAYTLFVLTLGTFAFLNAQISGDITGNTFVWLAAGAALSLERLTRPTPDPLPSPLPE